jgi:hypothetical protein
MDWLFDHRSLVYLLLASDFVVLLAVWWRTRKRGLVIALGVSALIAGLFALVDLVLRPETDQEKLERTVRELAQSLKEPVDTAKLEKYISDDVDSKQHLKKKAFVKAIADLSDANSVREVRVSDLRDMVIDRNGKTASVRFNATVYSGRDQNWTGACETDFVLEDDGQWRLKRYRIFLLPTSTEEFTPTFLP